jgi:DNA repair protein RecO (recombination protein O)
MTTYVDEGIVLRRVDYGETDRVLTVLTRTHGKVGVIARGVRKQGSRLAPHTDLFARSTMQLARGRGQLEVLAEAQRVGPVPPRSDARRAACAALCAELADSVLEPDHPLEPGIFELLADPRAAVAWFARRMIDRLGYAPELRRCANCGAELAEQPASFSAAGGGLLCPRCAPLDPGGVDCTTTVIKVLRVIASGDADLYWRLRLTPAVLAALEAVVERELAQHVDRRLRSLEVLRAVF